MLPFDTFFRVDRSQQLWFDQQHQRILRHKQQLNEQQIKRRLQNHGNEEQLRYGLRQYQQRYQTANEQQQFSKDDEPVEKWKFYHYSRRL